MVGQQPPARATIEWEMMDKTKFFPLSMLSTFSIRCVLYPLTLIKTRLQVQKRNAVYTGMFDAYGKIYKYEGFSGLYKGFWISSFQIVSGVCYLSVYETVRHILFTNNVKDSRLVALLSGAGASVVGQSIIVPFDVVSQHMMMTGIHSNVDKAGFNSLGVQLKPHYSKLRITIEISKEIMRRDGFRGFYRGYWASLATYVPNSSLWWTFYHLYQEKLCAVAPLWVSHLLLQAIAGTLGGFTTTIITNPLDVIRARLQVQRIGSVRRAFTELWREEGVWMFSKGLSARLVHSPFFSFSVILGYETIKRISVKEEYRNQVRW